MQNLNNNIFKYFLISYLFTWSFHLLIPILGFKFSFGIDNPALYLYLFGLTGPLFSSIYLSRKDQGGKGIQKLLLGTLKWKVNIVWYLTAIFIIPAVNLLSILIFNSELSNMAMTVPMLLIVGQLWVVISEEYGWRGYALPRLQNRFGSLGAAFILGFLWASWHLPMFFVQGSFQYTESFFYDFSRYVVLLTCWTIIMVMLYNKTKGSVLICMIFHACANITAIIIAVPAESDYTFQLLIIVATFTIFLFPKPYFIKSKKQLLS